MEDRIGSTQKLLNCLIETATLATGEGRERNPPLCRKTNDSARDVADRSVQLAHQGHCLLGTTQNREPHQSEISCSIGAPFTEKNIFVYAELEKRLTALLACHLSSPARPVRLDRVDRLPGRCPGEPGSFPATRMPMIIINSDTLRGDTSKSMVLVSLQSR